MDIYRDRPTQHLSGFQWRTSRHGHDVTDRSSCVRCRNLNTNLSPGGLAARSWCSCTQCANLARCSAVQGGFSPARFIYLSLRRWRRTREHTRELRGGPGQLSRPEPSAAKPAAAAVARSHCVDCGQSIRAGPARAAQGTGRFVRRHQARGSQLRRSLTQQNSAHGSVGPAAELKCLRLAAKLVEKWC